MRYHLILTVFLLLVLSSGVHAVNAQSVAGNFTVNSDYVLPSNLNYTGWVIIGPGASLYTGNHSFQAKGILLMNGSVLNVSNVSALVGVSYLYNNGSVYYSQDFLNASDIVNYGSITHQNWLLHYQNLSYSYGGSGGGGGTNYGSGATEGFSTKVSGGGTGNDPAGSGSQAPLLGNVSVPILNESMLTGATGGNSSCTPGAAGAYGFVIISSSFYNYGKIANEGKQAPAVCYDSAYDGGGGGAGGGGVVEVVYSHVYVNRGEYDLSGGGLNPDFNGPYTYGGWGGAGGSGQLILARINSTSFPPILQTTNLTTNKTNASQPTIVSSLAGNISMLATEVRNLTAVVGSLQRQLATAYSNISSSLSGQRNEIQSGYSSISNALNGLYGYDSSLSKLVKNASGSVYSFDTRTYNEINNISLSLESLAAAKVKKPLPNVSEFPLYRSVGPLQPTPAAKAQKTALQTVYSDLVGGIMFIPNLIARFFD